MDMTERDDELLMQFFSEHKQEIFDKGLDTLLLRGGLGVYSVYTRLGTGGTHRPHSKFAVL